MFSRTNKAHFVFLLIAACLSFVMAGTANADIIPEFAPDVIFNGTDFTWEWEVNLTEDQVILPGNLFEIFDFAGFVPGSMFNPAGWLASSPASGPMPALFGADDPGLVNLVWTRDLGAPIGDGSADVALGVFGARSTSGFTKLGQYAGNGTSSDSGLPHANFGPTMVPDPPIGEPSPVPEPGTMTLLSCGAIGLIGKLRKGRKQEETLTI